MTTLQQAAQQLIDFHDGPAEAKRHDVFIRRIESIRAALAQQEADKPFQPDWVNYRQGVEDGKAEALAQQGEPVAWFAFADSNGPVPLELYGWDEKACKHAVLTYARAGNWKGTVEGYLMQQGWTLKPVYAAAPAPQAQPVAQQGGKDRDGWPSGFLAWWTQYNIKDLNRFEWVARDAWNAAMQSTQPAQPQASDHSEQHLDMVAQPLRELSDEEIRETADCIVANLDGRKGVINLDLDDDLVEEIMQEMCDTIKSAVLKKASE